VLKEAQRKGFAEANPKMDLEGYDAAYKAAILASVAFNALIPCWSVYREGIERISSEDIRFADSIGYVIKLLAIAKRQGGTVEVRVHPALVAKSHPLANINENFNAIYVKGFPVGELMFYGPGAGGNPTASAVISDILALNKPYTPIPLPLKRVKISPIGQIESRYYIRLEAPDRFGVLAAISRAFAAKKVSIAAVTQEETKGNLATIVILLHQVKEANLKAALRQIAHLSVVKKISNVIRII
jgi:homoserine dehydrogenase